MLFLFLVLLFNKPPLSLEMSRSEGLKYHSYLNIPISNNMFSKDNIECLTTSGFILAEKNQHASGNERNIKCVKFCKHSFSSFLELLIRTVFV